MTMPNQCGTVILSGDGSNYSGAVRVGDGTHAAGILWLEHDNACGTNMITLGGTGLSALYISGGITVPNLLTFNGIATSASLPTATCAACPARIPVPVR